MGMSLGNLMWTALDLVGVAGNEDHNQRLRQLQQETFLRLRFEGVDGQWLDGSAMQVIWKGVPSQENEDDAEGTSIFWYCLGPDAHLYVAMPISFRIGFGWRVEWKVQPFSNALHKKPAALYSEVA